MHHLINNLDKLEKLLGKRYRNVNREAFSKEIFQHPLRFTDYLLRQIKKHPAIAKQYLPDPRELDSRGIEKPFTGVINTGVPGLERMYLDRVILMPTSQCFAYCRFCFRKNYSHDARKGDYGTPQDSFEKAIRYIKKDKRIKEVLITGGDPLMFPKQVLSLVEKLRQMKHLTGLRIGSRIFTSDPKQITEEWVEPWKNFGYPCPVSISPHINHPSELSRETCRALLLCTQNQIPLYNQTVLLKGVNDDPEILIELFRKLRQLGVEPYRVYLADPLKGTEYFRVSIKRFMELKRYLRANASGRIVPSFIIDTRIGKLELGADGEIVKRSGNTVLIQTPYNAKIFTSMNPKWKLPDYCTLAKNGEIIVEYEDADREG